MMGPVKSIRVEGLRKLYGKKVAVQDVSFSMKNGEIVGLLGPNGAGKTTVFYMIVGFIHATAGKIYLDEHNITRRPMYKRALAGISYLPQEASVFRKLTVEQNIAFGPQMQKVPKKEIATRVADAIEAEACDILGYPDLRSYFRDPRKGFFAFHIKRYSKSRRKAPIYWLLQSEKRNYAIWLYSHRLQPFSLYVAGRSYADAKENLETTRLQELRQSLETLSGAVRRRREREIVQQEKLVNEVIRFRKTLDRIALLNLPPDPNDGVVISIAPLWELLPWKEAKRIWDKLMAGEYDWSSMSRLMKERGLIPS